MASTYLSRSISSNGNPKIWTFSAWVKKQYIGTTYLLSANDGSTYSTLSFAGDQLRYYDYWSGAIQAELKTNRKFRDIHGWYHIVVRYKTTESTASDRIKFYVNGVQVTSFATSSYPANTNWDSYFNSSSQTNYINYESGGTMKDVTMSHVHFCDGYAYDASAFGSTDATTGEWKINTSPSVSYGTNGYWILKDGNSVTDQSSNTNNWTVGGGTLTKTEDCPDNVFCTLNEFDAYLNYSTLSNGNNTLTGGSQSVNYSMIRGTIGDTSGKYYWEVKAVDNAEIDQVGVMTTDLYVTGHASSGGLQATSWGGRGIQFSNGYKVANNSGSAYMGGFSANDILMVALDLDNTKITFGRNGQWSNGSGSCNQTYANSTPAYTDLDSTKFYLPAHCQRDSAGNNSGTSQYNFGNGYFGTTQISSEGTNASGIGKFEYDVPSGFTALSTKGLNE